MVLFRHHSIRRDLVVIIMTISLLSIVLTSLAISYIHYLSLKERLVRDLQTTAEGILQQNSDLLPFADTPNIRRKLFANINVLQNAPDIRLACLYSKDKSLAAFFDAADHALNDQAASRTAG